ncbi:MULTISPECIES: GFA family protein [Pseudoalteromonas]|uniref:GFA family protein n=1 Tax=Pseudoalteromonas TaxID=53246 RepID=UPI000F78CEBA|nr:MULTISPECIES: GFA family protein [Pseudoalteromonas]MCG7564320.1 GFA family protein [Pseudoalteromonas sp. McH1-42]MEC4087795.1 GFA family protein [Pseudoalteromonas rubra]
MKYTGSCHCKAVQFEFESEQITEALQCNCSVCIRKNAIMSKQSFTSDVFLLLSGKAQLSTYHWGDCDVNHYFCKVCGIYPFHDTTYEPGTYRVNLGCVDGLEPRLLSIIEFDGKNQL